MPHSCGADCGFLNDSPTRLKIDLAGSWGFLSGGDGGTVRVPGAYEFVGQVTFDRKFSMTAKQLDEYQFHLVMYGANYNTSVWVNGDFLMNHVGGYTSFLQVIPSNQLQVGDENVVKVVTNNALDPRRSIPLRPQVSGWRNYGGILRDVFLLGTPKFYISDVAVRTDPQSDSTFAKLEVTASFDGLQPGAHPAGFAFFAELVDSSGAVVGRCRPVRLVREENRWGEVHAELAVDDPLLWSPERPAMYTLKCYLRHADTDLLVDEYVLRYGIRTLELEDGNCFLNGKRLVLQGVVWQEDHPARGSSLSLDDMERDVAMVKSLGANAIRFGNHPPHPSMLSFCDRYGLLALLEMPVTHVPAQLFHDEYYLDLAHSMWKEMIHRDRNHPSVIAWGIGDEFESSSEQAREFVEGLVKSAKRLDDRWVYYGTTLLGSDMCADLVDVVLIDPPTSDVKQFKGALEAWNARHLTKPLIIGKLGTEVQEGNHNGYSDPRSYEAQARFFLQRFEAAKSLNCDGAFALSFNDWKGDRPALTASSGDPWMRTLGLVNSNRERRLAADAVRSLFRGEKFSSLPIGSYTQTAPIVYVLVGLVMLIGTAYLYNVSRRFRESLNRSLMNSYNFFADLRDQHAVPIPLTLTLGMVVSLGTATVLSTFLFHFRQNVILDAVLSYALGDDTLKEAFVYLVRRPVAFVAVFAVLLFAALLVVSAIVKIASRFFKARVSPYHAFSVTMWSSTPLLSLVPVGMVLYRVLEGSIYVVPSVAFFCLLFLWVVIRLLKGMSILFEVSPPKMYLIGLLSLAGVLALGFLYQDYTHSASMYVKFMYHMRGGLH